ncbi:MAG: hypothetical protein EXR27_12905 [Betaproteobacteria bacterium]|nr:hypothetical protein [Betaproteobacteria bacterium]
MPISLRLPADIETQIAGYGARLGLTKSAVIVRSIQEFLARHAQPSSLQIYEDAMRDATPGLDNAARETSERRPHKLKLRAALRRKHARRSERAARAPTKRTPGTGSPA